MSRLFLLAAIVAVIYLLISSFRRNAAQQGRHVTEDMVRCAHCGVHLPKGESILTGENYFCCPEHRDAYRK